MKKVSAGDPLVIPARAWNEIADAVSRSKLERSGQGAEGTSAGIKTGVIRVKNCGKEMLRRFSALSLEESLVYATGNESYFTATVPALNGYPVTDENKGKPWAITLDPADKGEICRAMVLGVVTARVDIKEEEDGYAEPKSGSKKGELVSAKSGTCRILWKESGTGEKWCVLLMSGYGDGRTLHPFALRVKPKEEDEGEEEEEEWEGPQPIEVYLPFEKAVTINETEVVCTNDAVENPDDEGWWELRKIAPTEDVDVFLNILFGGYGATYTAKWGVEPLKEVPAGMRLLPIRIGHVKQTEDGNEISQFAVGHMAFEADVEGDPYFMIREDGKDKGGKAVYSIREGAVCADDDVIVRVPGVTKIDAGVDYFCLVTVRKDDGSVAAATICTEPFPPLSGVAYRRWIVPVGCVNATGEIVQRHVGAIVLDEGGGDSPRPDFAICATKDAQGNPVYDIRGGDVCVNDDVVVPVAGLGGIAVGVTHWCVVKVEKSTGVVVEAYLTSDLPAGGPGEEYRRWTVPVGSVAAGGVIDQRHVGAIVLDEGGGDGMRPDFAIYATKDAQGNPAYGIRGGDVCVNDDVAVPVAGLGGIVVGVTHWCVVKVEKSTGVVVEAYLTSDLPAGGPGEECRRWTVPVGSVGAGGVIDQRHVGAIVLDEGGDDSPRPDFAIYATKDARGNPVYDIRGGDVCVNDDVVVSVVGLGGIAVGVTYWCVVKVNEVTGGVVEAYLTKDRPAGGPGEEFRRWTVPVGSVAAGGVIDQRHVGAIVLGGTKAEGNALPDFSIFTTFDARGNPVYNIRGGDVCVNDDVVVPVAGLGGIDSGFTYWCVVKADAASGAVIEAYLTRKLPHDDPTPAFRRWTVPVGIAMPGGHSQRHVGAIVLGGTKAEGNALPDFSIFPSVDAKGNPVYNIMGGDVCVNDDVVVPVAGLGGIDCGFTYWCVVKVDAASGAVVEAYLTRNLPQDEPTAAFRRWTVPVGIAMPGGHSQRHVGAIVLDEGGGDGMRPDFAIYATKDAQGNPAYGIRGGDVCVNDDVAVPVAGLGGIAVGVTHWCVVKVEKSTGSVVEAYLTSDLPAGGPGEEYRRWTVPVGSVGAGGVIDQRHVGAIVLDEGGCAEAKAGSGRFELTDSFGFENQYYDVGGRTYKASVPPLASHSSCIAALKVAARGYSPSAEVATYATFADLESAQQDMSHYVTPLYEFGSDGTVKCDFRTGPVLSMGEF